MMQMISNRQQRKADRSKKHAKQKSVSFKRGVDVKKGLHLKNYTDEEIKASWYSREELQNIKVENDKTLSLVSWGALKEDNDSYCRRGLEASTKDGYQLRFRRRLDACIAVLEVQEFSKQGRCDYSMISQAYSRHTRRCAKEAYMHGLQDQQDASTTTCALMAAMRLTTTQNNQPKQTLSPRSSRNRLRQLFSRAA